jgi:hypothetical protein
MISLKVDAFQHIFLSVKQLSPIRNTTFITAHRWTLLNQFNSAPFLDRVQQQPRNLAENFTNLAALYDHIFL